MPVRPEQKHVIVAQVCVVRLMVKRVVFVDTIYQVANLLLHVNVQRTN